jgi:DNA-directed RNA polymerase specialized sigma24 family protein
MSVPVVGPECQNARFCTTRWSLVVRVNGSDVGAVADALESLCRIYWRPIFEEIRRRGWPEADSKDLAQEFFVRLLKRDAFGKADREKGRLRTYLLGALDYFLIDVARSRQAVKRGGDAVMLPIDPGGDGAWRPDVPGRGATPAEVFDQRWALVLMDRALEALLADGSGITLSSPIVGGNEVPVFVQLVTPGAASSMKGGCLGGMVQMNASQPDSDMTAAGLRWIRPSVFQLSGTTAAARATQMYTDGWPSGITVDMIGALYDRGMDAGSALSLGPVDPVNGNGRLLFSGAGLQPDVSVTRFNIQPATTAGATIVTKIPATNNTFSLMITQSSGFFNGTFTPNWTKAVSTKPSFKGVLLQKGAAAGGYGYFHSNRSNDADPESGRVVLDGGEP